MKGIAWAGFLMTAFTLPAQTITQPEIALWPNGAPGSEGHTRKELVTVNEQGEHMVASIDNPTITPYLPNKNNATGMAVVIAPGGGHKRLYIDTEGYAPAQWLADHGVAAFVLKNRLSDEDGSPYTIQAEYNDMQRALRIVRHRAGEWDINPDRIGVIGFSAGGELASYAAIKFDSGNPDAIDPVERESCRPAFQAMIYPGIPNLQPTPDTPPLFILCGFDDRNGIAPHAADLFKRYKEAGIETELHIYANVNHGFGLRASNSGPIAGWPMRLLEWMKTLF